MESLLVTFDEVYSKGKARYRLGDHLRELITERRVHVNIKNGYKGDRDIFCNFMFLSNHIDAMEIPDEDRRLWVVILDEKPKSMEWYNKVYALLDNQEAINQLYWFLKQIADNAEPHARAPQNTARALLRQAGKDEFEQIADDTINQLRERNVEVIFLPQLEAILRSEGLDLPLDRGDPTHHRLRSHLRDYQCIALKARQRMPSKSKDMFHVSNLATVITINRTMHWSHASNSDVIQAARAALEEVGASLVPVKLVESKEPE